VYGPTHTWHTTAARNKGETRECGGEEKEIDNGERMGLDVKNGREREKQERKKSEIEDLSILSTTHLRITTTAFCDRPSHHNHHLAFVVSHGHSDCGTKNNSDDNGESQE